MSGIEMSGCSRFRFRCRLNLPAMAANVFPQRLDDLLIEIPPCPAAELAESLEFAGRQAVAQVNLNVRFHGICN